MIFFITVGRAADADHAAPPNGSVRARPEGERLIDRHDRSEHHHLQPEMRERVHDRPRHRPPIGFDGRPASARSAATQSSSHSVDGTSSMPPRSPASGRLRNRTCPSSRSARKRNAITRWPLAFFDLRGQLRFNAERMRMTILLQRTHETRRPLRRTDRGAEIHHGLREIAGLRAGVRVAANRLISGLALGSGVFTAKRRDVTRSILPSTGVAFSPNAIAAMAAAV